MKVILSEDFSDMLFKGKELLPSQREAVFNDVLDSTQAIPDTVWLHDKDKFMEEVIDLHPNKPSGYYALMNTLYKHLHPVFYMQSSQGVVITNMLFNCDINVITVIISTRNPVTNIKNKFIKETVKGDHNESDPN